MPFGYARDKYNCRGFNLPSYQGLGYFGDVATNASNFDTRYSIPALDDSQVLVENLKYYSMKLSKKHWATRVTVGETNEINNLPCTQIGHDPTKIGMKPVTCAYRR